MTARDYSCPVCGYWMALAPLRWVRVIHLKAGRHSYRIVSRP